MREEIKELQHRFNLSTIYVTHDQEEAMAISDRIIIMREGNIEQAGKPLDIYDAPRTRFVADFIGAANILVGSLEKTASNGAPIVKVGEALIECAAGSQPQKPTADGRHMVAVRTVYPELRREPFPASANQWKATIGRRVLLGDIVSYIANWPGGELRIQSFPRDLFNEGETVHLQIAPTHAVPIAAD
jgi:iron(III) transport system ATP-binding protein